MLFGTAYCSSESNIRTFAYSKNHETVHVHQAVSTKDSWFRYYIEYVWEWICNFPLIFINIYAPYKFIPMELDAYKNEENDEYVNQEKCEEWRKFKEIPLKSLWKYAREWYSGKRYTMSFRTFVNTIIKCDEKFS